MTKGTCVLPVDALDDSKIVVIQVIASMIAVCEFTWRRRKLAVDEDVGPVYF